MTIFNHTSHSVLKGELSSVMEEMYLYLYHPQLLLATETFEPFVIVIILA